MTEEKVYWVWLSTVPGIGARRFYKLIECFGTPRGVWEASLGALRTQREYLGDKTFEQIHLSRQGEILKKAELALSTPGIRVVTLVCPEYPPLLKTIYDPPPVLYLKGQLLKTEPGVVAVVGSRRSSDYGRQAAARISEELAQAGIAVVSGLARGIDTFAHKGALKAEGGYTAAVLGCGVDMIYPPENRWLYEKIAETGTLISEYPVGTHPASSNFPARNRIISGLAQGVLVVEAGLKSGALITVDFALEQGRDVYALPGNIGSVYSEGTNKLLKDGAKMITCVEDILEDFHSFDRLKAQKPPKAPLFLDFFENEVYNALEEGAKSLDALIILTGMEPGRLQAALTLLEIKGIIKQNPGKIFMLQWKA